MPGLPVLIFNSMDYCNNNNLGNCSYFTRECNETGIAGGPEGTHSLTRSLDFVKYFIYGNYNVPYA